MKRNLRYLTIMIGCLLAVVIVCSQVYTVVEKSSATVEQTDADTSDTDHATISMATFSLPSPVTLQINLDPHCLFEIVLAAVAKEETDATVPSVDEKLFVTLFRVIISPNAP